MKRPRTATAQYVLRMDDACPRMDHAKWERLEAIFDRWSIKPVVAVVPSCEDPELNVSDENPSFWNTVAAWQAKGWSIAMHGWNHVYLGQRRGLVPLNARTEFAGIPESVQRLKIREGFHIFQENSITPTVWIAPAHSFDKTTLRVLQEETPIRIVSDGLARRPFLRYGMTWVPQQLWRPRTCPAGVWTICLHPSAMTDEMFKRVEDFLKDHARECVTIESVVTTARPWGLWDGVFELGFRVARRAKILLGSIRKSL